MFLGNFAGKFVLQDLDGLGVFGSFQSRNVEGGAGAGVIDDFLDEGRCISGREEPRGDVGLLERAVIADHEEEIAREGLFSLGSTESIFSIGIGVQAERSLDVVRFFAGPGRGCVGEFIIGDGVDVVASGEGQQGGDMMFLAASEIDFGSVLRCELGGAGAPFVGGPNAGGFHAQGFHVGGGKVQVFLNSFASIPRTETVKGAMLNGFTGGHGPAIGNLGRGEHLEVNQFTKHLELKFTAIWGKGPLGQRDIGFVAIGFSTFGESRRRKQAGEESGGSSSSLEK